METFSSRFDTLNSFEKSMRMLLRERSGTNKQEFQQDMIVVIRYISSIKEGVFLANEIKTSFEYYLPKIENVWKEKTYAPLVHATERYTESLTRHLQKQQELFEQVSVIIASLDIVDGSESIKSTVRSTLVPITIEFKIIKILCQIHNVLFSKDQEKLSKAIEEFLFEFQHLDDYATQPLIQLRGLIEQIRVVSEMPSDADLVKELLQKVVDIAQNFIHSFCGE
jgi:hypothetical protein